jgi:glyoxylase-like metal-dependent hydrolase (beta-lactamase superfamily II)
MIDAGWPDTFSQLLQLLNQNNISVNLINHLLITHFHPSHAGLTQNLRDLGTNLIVHEYQVPFINNLNVMYKKNPKANFRDIANGNYVVLKDWDTRSYFKSIGIDGELISTPGHSDDSVSFILDEGYAFIGDLPSLPSEEEAFDLIIDDSWNHIKSHQVNTIYPGHGEPYLLN